MHNWHDYLCSQYGFKLNAWVDQNWQIQATDDGLGLVAQTTQFKPIVVSFLAGKNGYRFSSKQPRTSLLERAIGKQYDHVVDASLGWGSDAFSLLKAGFKVTAIEQSNVVIALVEDAVWRYMKHLNTDLTKPFFNLQATFSVSDWRQYLAQCLGVTLHHGDATLVSFEQIPDPCRSSALL